MKKALLVLSLLAICVLGSSQQIPQYTQYNLNYLTLNPAVAGSKECLDLKLGYRSQWVGLPGSPQTAFVNAHAKISGDPNKSYHGLGGVIENDDAGPIDHTSFRLAYAYNFKPKRGLRMAFGLGLGVTQMRLDASQMTLPDVGAVDDPAILGNQAEFIFPTVDFGFWMYSRNYFAGFSVRNLVERELQNINNDTKLNRHFMLSYGRSIRLEDDWSFIPSANLRYVAGSRVAADLTLMMDYADLVSAGLAFRSEHGISGLFKVNAFRYVTVGYAYDLTLNKIRLNTRSTHEIILGIQACPKGGGGKANPCSAYD